MERVMMNIIDNALKYSHAGTPVSVAARADGEWVVMEVADRGVGIPSAEIPNIFTHFYRASNAMGTPGTGIGLAGAKQIVEQHGGSIELISRQGHGTTVRVRMPRAMQITDGDNESPEGREREPAFPATA